MGKAGGCFLRAASWLEAKAPAACTESGRVERPAQAEMKHGPGREGGEDAFPIVAEP